MYKSLVFGDEFLAHLKSHQRCSAGIRTCLSTDQSSSSTLTEYIYTCVHSKYVLNDFLPGLGLSSTHTTLSMQAQTMQGSLLVGRSGTLWWSLMALWGRSCKLWRRRVWSTTLSSSSLVTTGRCFSVVHALCVSISLNIYICVRSQARAHAEVSWGKRRTDEMWQRHDLWWGNERTGHRTLAWIHPTRLTAQCLNPATRNIQCFMKLKTCNLCFPIIQRCDPCSGQLFGHPAHLCQTGWSCITWRSTRRGRDDKHPVESWSGRRQNDQKWNIFTYMHTYIHVWAW